MTDGAAAPAEIEADGAATSLGAAIALGEGREGSEETAAGWTPLIATEEPTADETETEALGADVLTELARLVAAAEAPGTAGAELEAPAPRGAARMAGATEKPTIAISVMTSVHHVFERLAAMLARVHQS